MSLRGSLSRGKPRGIKPDFRINNGFLNLHTKAFYPYQRVMSSKNRQKPDCFIKSLTRRLLEPEAALTRLCGLYNPVQLQHNSNKAIPV
jgi:hypothetical protein